MSKETFYFSHDYNARNDIKIKRLISKHGYLGYGLFWAIIEELYNNANALPLDYDVLAFDLRCDYDVIKSVIEDFELFVIDGDTFGSASVERRLNERNEKSLKAKRSAELRWKKTKKYANALQTESDSNAIKESKGKESKGKENKENTFLLEKETKNNICDISEFEVLEYEEIKKEKSSAKKENKFNFKTALLDYGFDSKLVDEWLQIRKTKKAVNTETAFNSFIREIESRSCIINEVLQTIVENSWSGFKFRWIDNLNIKNNGNGQQQVRSSAQVFIDTSNSETARNFKL